MNLLFIHIEDLVYIPYTHKRTVGIRQTQKHFSHASESHSVCKQTWQVKYLREERNTRRSMWLWLARCALYVQLPLSCRPSVAGLSQQMNLIVKY